MVKKKRSHTMESPQQKIMSSGSKTDGRFRSGKLHIRWVDKNLLLRRALKVLSRSQETRKYQNKVSKDGWSMLVRCSRCSKVSWLHIYNLLRSKSKACSCVPRKNRRTSFMEDSGHLRIVVVHALPIRPNKHYGARGIRMKFTQPQFIAYCKKKFSMRNIIMQKLRLDRKDNDGHYTPDNIRFVTASVSCTNRRKSVTRHSLKTRRLMRAAWTLKRKAAQARRMSETQRRRFTTS